MEPSIDLLGNLYDLLLLQCLTHLDELRGVTLQDGFVHIAGVREAHDDVPMGLLSKHLVGLGHINLLRQAGRIVPVGHPQEHTVVVGLQCPDGQIAGRRHQRTIVVVGGIAQGVVVGENLTTGLEELHLIRKTSFGEDADGLLGGGLIATERHIETHNLLHTLGELSHIVLRQRIVVLLFEVTVVATRDGVFDEEFRTREDILSGFVEQETERAHIGTVTRAGTGIQKLYFPVLKESELQTLGDIIDFGRNHGVRHLELVGEILIDVEQG